MQLIIAKEFSPHPIGRYKTDSDHSAELFREKFLIPRLRKAFEKNEKLEVIFEGLLGCSSSFLEEAFGGLVRSENRPAFDSLDDLKRHFEISSGEGDNYKIFIDRAWDYIREEMDRTGADS